MLLVGFEQATGTLASMDAEFPRVDGSAVPETNQVLSSMEKDLLLEWCVVTVGILSLTVLLCPIDVGLGS